MVWAASINADRATVSGIVNRFIPGARSHQFVTGVEPRPRNLSLISFMLFVYCRNASSICMSIPMGCSFLLSSTRHGSSLVHVTRKLVKRRCTVGTQTGLAVFHIRISVLYIHTSINGLFGSHAKIFFFRYFQSEKLLHAYRERYFTWSTLLGRRSLTEYSNYLLLFIICE